MIRWRDCRAVGFCRPGTQEWCRRHNIDFLKLVREGITDEELAGVECPLLDTVRSYVNEQQQKADGRL